MNSKSEPEYGTSCASATDDRADSNFFNVILTLYQNIGLIYGFYDGQPYTKNNVNGERSDGSERDTQEK